MRQWLNSRITGSSGKIFWLDTTLRSYAQFVMQSLPMSGIICIVIIGITNWWLLLATMISCINANAVALHLGAPVSVVQQGLLGWNPVLLTGILEADRRPRWHALPMLVFVSTLCSLIAVGFRRYLPARLSILQGSLPCTLTQMIWECMCWIPVLASGELVQPLPAAGAHPVHPASLQGLFDATATSVCALTFSGVAYPYVWFVTVGLALGEPRICGMIWAGALAGASVDMLFGAPISHRTSGVSGLMGMFAFFTTHEVSRPSLLGTSTVSGIIVSTCSALAAAFLSQPFFGLRGCFPYLLVAIVANGLDLVAAYREHMAGKEKTT